MKLNCMEGIRLQMSAPIEELKHQDYKGKRTHIEILDDAGNVLSLKMDIGVHKDLDIEQEEYCFDVSFQEDAASVLINSREQMITEKLKSLMRFGTRSTRYKDVFDICYLSDMVDNMEKLRFCIQKYIYADTTIDVNDADEIRKKELRESLIVVHTKKSRWNAPRRIGLICR